MHIKIRKALLTATDEAVVHDDQVLPSEFRIDRREFAPDTLLSQSLVRKDKSAMDVSTLDQSRHIRLP